MSVSLDVRNDRQVVGHAALRTPLDARGLELIVVSGTGVVEQTVDSTTNAEIAVDVRLGQAVGVLRSSAAYVGLASISNGDSAWVFCTDRAVVSVRNGELYLGLWLAVMGEPSFLHRFLFEVVVEVVPA
ncbi:hypothetical protein [Tessaracoccus antarcticus]|uniref:Uncharacterized protein n=1 Tax=Tessaracoccus antarcticus TaxID=2479848 RepID=A0A3M0G890_9ACTN|nr:hypothetical protein [Tessaracoccus antarcticus]RMB57259.1 hypothetical protein EAX62_16110 [Tessaracoccus antarcticus]